MKYLTRIGIAAQRREDWLLASVVNQTIVTYYPTSRFQPTLSCMTNTHILWTFFGVTIKPACKTCVLGEENVFISIYDRLLSKQ